MQPAHTTSQNTTRPADTQQMIVPPGASEPLKAAFTGSAQRSLYERYGDPRIKGWGNKWMVIWQVQQAFPWFPAQKIYIHKDFRVKLQEAFHALEQAGVHHEIKTFDGCYNIRHVRGSDSALSIHSWGAAIDLNAADNPLGSNGTWSAAFLKVMSSHGIYCGQNWKGRKDPMHFALVNG